MGKRNFHLVMEDKTIKAFRAYIIDKTGDLKKGDLSKWIEIIINRSIREDQQQHTTYNMQLSVEEEMIIVLTDLMKEMTKLLWNDPQHPMDLTCGNDCHKKTLRYAISNVKNVHNSRTIKKWIDRLLEFEFIRQIKKDWYKILNDGHNSLQLENKEVKELGV